jgi:hypothetical protein
MRPIHSIIEVEGHRPEVLRYSHKALDLTLLLIPHLFIGLQDLSLLHEILSHLHDLVHVLILELNDLRKGLLVHVDHLHVLLLVCLDPVGVLLLLCLLLLGIRVLWLIVLESILRMVLLPVGI